MLDVPLVFVLSVNPDPIGQAIKHQFGLESEWGDYEARKILEKFVDQYLGMEENDSIVPYVRSLWSANGLDLSKSCFIARADAQLNRPPYNEDTLKHASFDHCILGNNPMYGNRRLLAKCLQRTQLPGTRTPLKLTAWHLELAAQAYPQLRHNMALLAGDLGWITGQAHVDLIDQLVLADCIDSSTGDVKHTTLRCDKGACAFSVYRSVSWERARERCDELRKDKDREAGLRLNALQELMDDPRKMDFVVVGLMQPLGPIKGWNRSSGGFEVRGWHDLYPGSHLEYLLFNY